MGTGITFDETIHTERDLGLKLLSIYIPMPEPKRKTIDLPGGDGTLDFSEMRGRPVYNDREGLELVFDILDGDYKKWFLKYSDVAKKLHGKKIKMVLDDDLGYYYMVRLNVDGKKTNPVYGQLTFTGSAEPFKYDTTSSMEEWKWDDFNFFTGVIRTLADITITSTNNKIKILGAGIETAPVFVVKEANNLKLTHNGRTYPLKAGRNRFPAVLVGEEDVTLTFTGTGRLSVDYRGRYL